VRKHAQNRGSILISLSLATAPIVILFVNGA